MSQSVQPDVLLVSDFSGMAEVENLGAMPEYPKQMPLDLPAGGPGSWDERRQGVGTVLFDPKIGRCRMWYVAAPAFDGTLAGGFRVAYAESENGLHWTKPELGLVEYGGSTRNNLVSGLPSRMDGVSVIADTDGKFKMVIMDARVLSPAEVADPRIRARLNPTLQPAFMGIAESEDGVRWRFESDGRPAICEKFEIGRLYRVGGHYIMNGQQGSPFIDHPDDHRCVVFYQSGDLKHWTKLPGYFHLENGPLDQCHCGISPCLTVGRTLVGLSGRFHNAPELPEQNFDVDLAYSHNGTDWALPFPASPWLRRGEPGGWNGGGIRQAQGYAENGDDMYFYFFGLDRGNDLSSAHVPGIAGFRRHRFACAGIHVGWDIDFTGTRRGMLRTPVIRRGTRGEVALNCGNFIGPGHLRVALTDAGGRELPGFGLADSLPVAEDGLAVKVRWRKASPLPEEFAVRVVFSGKGLCPDLPRLYTIALQ